MSLISDRNSSLTCCILCVKKKWGKICFQFWFYLSDSAVSFIILWCTCMLKLIFFNKPVWKKIWLIVKLINVNCLGWTRVLWTGVSLRNDLCALIFFYLWNLLVNSTQNVTKSSDHMPKSCLQIWIGVTNLVIPPQLTNNWGDTTNLKNLPIFKCLCSGNFFSKMQLVW